MRRLAILFTILGVALGLGATGADSLAGAFSGPLKWRVGVEASGGFVPRTNSYLKGTNPINKTISRVFSGTLRADFNFNPDSRWGRMYDGVYQGVGVDLRTFFVGDLLGTPGSAYVYQGAPFMHFSDRLSLGYEWKFGAAFGWKHYDENDYTDNTVVSTSVTAHMALGLKLHYRLSTSWLMSFGAEVTHFSNGNTSWPNGGVNTISASVGLAYVIDPCRRAPSCLSGKLAAEADRPSWFYDIVAFGAWRKRAVEINNMPELCPGKFAVAGLQFAPMRRFNRWFAAGAALDVQWDESAGIEPYWVDGTYDKNIKFYRPPFGKQINVGMSAHAELTMPIFSVNAGLGYDFINPQGNKRFYQSLTLKTFITKRMFLNVGYRLSRFKDPQNLMLGLGVRL